MPKPLGKLLYNDNRMKFQRKQQNNKIIDKFVRQIYVLCICCYLLSCVQLFATPQTAAPQASLSFIILWGLFRLISIVLMMPSSHLIRCYPLLLLPSILPSIRVFSNELVLCIRWAKYWSFSFSISPSNEYSGLISFRVDWLDLLVVQGILKSLLQYHSLSIGNT